ncbi:hypothetical protein [Sulfurisoma sediminicola]|uniref:Uncharacterized protein n=1 Tax=Sulfurisoma sediminicola TaxID=1381557 RepID=A0A497XCB5_9PROT|nr:hypothetical protein [Sulfurisoma sediminicola]RLJ64592.1 hypothetical protein DFR35_1233 [Sulfurisoma sediminicola]
MKEVDSATGLAARLLYLLLSLLLSFHFAWAATWQAERWPEAAARRSAIRALIVTNLPGKDQPVTIEAPGPRGLEIFQVSASAAHAYYQTHGPTHGEIALRLAACFLAAGLAVGTLRNFLIKGGAVTAPPRKE